jgi:PAS domain S-box-containing protein
MHYTDIAAATFPALAALPKLSNAARVSLGIEVVTLGGVALVAGVVATLIARAKNTPLPNSLFEQTPQALVYMDRDTRVFCVNAEFTRVFGYAPQEIQGRLLTEVIVPERLRDESRENTLLASQGQRVEVESVRLRKDGGKLEVLVVAVPVSVLGRRTGILVTYRDITERKAAESVLQASARRLLLAQENERRHLAREMHDEIGQLLTGLRLLLNINENIPPNVIRDRLGEGRGVADDLLGRVRRLASDLRPADLDQFGLVPALMVFFDRYASQTGVLVDFKHQGVEKRLAAELEITAYRVVQEALTNTARHAGVTTVTVRVWAQADILALQIADRGCGFWSEGVLKAPRSGGLLGMLERTALLNGKIDIESSPGAGTTITAELPVDYGKP